MNKLLSIIIPAYNLENYIIRCLDSLVSQTYSNIEIIVVDDGSKDSTPTLLDEYVRKDTRIKVIHKENAGVSLARLTGMKVAQGEYVGFVDGDDTVEPDMFEVLMNNAYKYNADISHCGYVMDYPNGKSVSYYDTGKVVVQDHQTGLEDLLRGDFVEPGLCNKIFKKDIIDSYINNSNMNYSIKNLEDLLVNYFLFNESNKSIYEDVCKYHYTLRSTSAAVSVSRNKLLDPLKVMTILMELNKDNKSLYDIVYSRYISILISNSTQKYYKDIRIDSRKELRKQVSSLKEHNISKKTELMCKGVAYCYPLYLLVRRIYEKITKIDKKYEV